MKMIKTLFLSCFFILTMSLTGCLTIEEGAVTTSTSTSTTSDSGGLLNGDGLFGTSFGDGQIGW